MFADRADAGRQLAAALTHLRGEDLLLLALPRGGVPVAFEISRQFKASLGLVLVRKIGAPYNREFAVGAVAGAADPVVVFHDSALRMMDLSREDMQPAVDREIAEIRKRRDAYGRDFIVEDLHAKTVILVDDGIATGATMEAAIEWARQRNPRRLVIAVPIGSPRTLAGLADRVDEIVCVNEDDWFSAVGSAYADFAQVSDETVRDLLRRAAEDGDNSGNAGIDGS